MNTTYKYKDKTYTHIYPLSEALGQEGIFIPLSLSDEALTELGVTVMREEEPIENVKQRKILMLKRQRDVAEVEPIAYNGHLYDYDSKARERINAAIIALDQQGADAAIAWTTADDNDVTVTAADLRAVIAAVAVRSNALHVKYRTLKQQVQECKTMEELEAIKWE
ncbi:DUF4376 domain-containing protein [Phascolarctobacterium succinatutens]|uniref:DUF4376 domain-containing protein n=1 Tax=Phascolarctobacterium succinatutens TaxID=626940 RepID=UPI0026EB4227|nr:DUF4376 domain-containing protein [Phascolarctobacterium succinatutens]